MWAILGADVVGAMFLLATATMVLFARHPGLRLVARVLAVLSAVWSLLPVTLGAIARRLTLVRLEVALATIDPDQSEALEQLGAIGRRVASAPFQFGLGSTVMLGLGAAMVLPLARRRVPTGSSGAPSAR
jgi:hypothetical protein